MRRAGPVNGGLHGRRECEGDVRRIVKTSGGWIVVDMSTHGWHDVTTYGEDAWEIDGAVWSEEHGADVGQPTFAAFVAATAAIPTDEAEQIARQVLREWNEREATVEAVRDGQMSTKATHVIFGVVGLAVVGALLGLAGLVWLVVTLL